MPLLRRLVSKGLLSSADLPALESAIGTSGKPPHEVLLDKSAVKENELFEVLAEEFGLERVDLAGKEVGETVLSLVPAKLVHRRQVMPIGREDHILIVAVSNPPTTCTAWTRSRRSRGWRCGRSSPARRKFRG